MRKIIKKTASLMLSVLVFCSCLGIGETLAQREYAGKLSIFQNTVDFKNAVYSEYNTVYVPMEEVCGYLNISVVKAEDGKFILTRVTDTLSFAVDNTVININGRDVTLPSAPTMRNGVVYIPAELFSMGFGMPMTKSADNRSADIEPNVYKIFIDEQNAAAISGSSPDADTIAASTSATDLLYYNATAFSENQKAVFYKFDFTPFNGKAVKSVLLNLYAARVSGTSPSIKITRTAPWEKGSINFTNAPVLYSGETLSKSLSNTSQQLVAFDVTSMAMSAKNSGEILSLRFDGVVPASRSTETANQITLRSVTNASPSYLQITLEEKYDFPVRTPEGAKNIAEEYSVVGLLRSMGVLRMEDEFPLNMNAELVSRGEFVKFAMRLCGDKAPEGSNEQYFSDVPVDNVYFKEVNAAREAGYVSGDKGIQFRPFDIITLNEATAIIGRILGYDVYAMQRGGYAQGYLEAATKQGILKGVPNGGGALSFSAMLKLLYNSLDAAMFEATIYTSSAGAEYAFDEDRTILSEYFDAKIIEGTVLANEYSALPGSSCAEGKINVEGKSLILKHKPYNEYLAYKVKAYYNSEDELIYMGVKDKNIDVIDLGDVNGSSKAGSVITVSYEDDNRKNKSESLSTSLTYIYNGKYVDAPTAELFIADGGEARIVGDRAVVITAYKTVAVYGVNTDTEIIYDRYDEYENSVLLKNKEYSFADEEGKEITLEHIVKNDIISVARSLDGEMIRGIVSKKSVTSAIELVENAGSEDMKVTVNGVEYKIKNRNPEWTGSLAIGKEGTFFIDVFGNIVGYTNEVGASEPGYLLTVQKISNGLSHKVQAAMMVKGEEEYKVYDFAQKIEIDGETMKTKSEANDIVSYFNYTYKDENNENVTEFERQGVIYTLNASGEICKLDTYKLGAGEDIEKNLYRHHTYEESPLRYKANTMGGIFYLDFENGLNVIQLVEENPTLEDFMTSKIAPSDAGAGHKFEAYTMGCNFPEAAIFARKGNVSESVASTARLSVVDKVVTTYDEDGYEIRKMYYYDGDERSSAPVADDKTDLVANVKRGDIVRFSVSETGEIKALTEYYDYETCTLAESVKNNLSSVNGYFCGASRTHGGYTTIVSEPYIKVSASADVSNDVTYTWVNYQKFQSFFYKYEADSSGIEVTKATLADIRPYNKVPFDPTGIILHSGYENMRKNVYLIHLAQPSGTGFNKVTYDAGAENIAGADELPGLTRVNIGDPFILPAFPSYLSREDYRVDESTPWMVKGVAYGVGESFIIEGDTVITPNWVYAPTARITLTAGEGTGAPVTEFCPENSTYTVRTIADFTKYGHVISGWRDEAGTFYRNGESVPVGSNDITLTAQWFKAWTGEVATSLSVDADGYYLISSGEELAAFGAMVEQDPTINGRLTENIYMNYYGNDGDYKWYESEDIEKAKNFFTYRIGKGNSDPYRGTFDGNGKTIYNIYIEGDSDTALFGGTDGATVKNLTIKNAYIVSAATASTTGKNTAVISGSATNTTIENCSLSGLMMPKSASHYMLCAGSVAGVTKGQTLIKNCSSTVNIAATQYINGVGTAKAGFGIGGIMGFASSESMSPRSVTTVEDCVYDGTINTPYNVMVGGVAGHLNQQHTLKISRTTVSGTLTAYTKGNNVAEENLGLLGHKSSTQSHSKLILGTGEDANTVDIVRNYTSN